VSRANAACASSSTTAPTSRSPIGADGVHLGQDDLDPVAARRLLGERFIIGYSTHTVAQAIEAARLPVDYIALGPIFDTHTKENPDPTIGLEALRRVRDSIDASVALVAIGGITSDTARAVLDAGADSVALVSALLAAPDLIAKRTKELRLSLS
jgi:thiamine-phosphate pyrophosphorylase